MLLPLAVAIAEELRSEDAGTRCRAEYRDVEHENKLVDDGNAAHLLSADLYDHYVQLHHGHLQV